MPSGCFPRQLGPWQFSGIQGAPVNQVGQGDIEMRGIEGLWQMMGDAKRSKVGIHFGRAEADMVTIRRWAGSSSTRGSGGGRSYRGDRYPAG